MRKILFLIIFTSCSVLCAMGDEGNTPFKSIDIKMLVGIDNTWLNFIYEVKIPENAPQLEEFCCSYLSGDHQFKTLDEYCLFQLNSYKKKKEWERMLCPGHDFLRIVPISNVVVNRFQTFHISVSYEYHKKGRTVRKDYTLIYDMQEHKVLTLEDIFIPALIEEINKDRNGKNISVAMTGNTILYGTDPTGNDMKGGYYAEIGEILTESFKQAINYEKIVAEYQRQKDKQAKLQAEQKERQEEAERIKKERQRKEEERRYAAIRERVARMEYKCIHNNFGLIQVSEHINNSTEMPEWLKDAQPVMKVGKYSLLANTPSASSKDSIWCSLYNLGDKTVDNQKNGVKANLSSTSQWIERTTRTYNSISTSSWISGQWNTTFKVDVPEDPIFEKHLCKILYNKGGTNLKETGDKFAKKFKGKKVNGKKLNSTTIHGEVLTYKPTKCYSYVYGHSYAGKTINHSYAYGNDYFQKSNAHNVDISQSLATEYHNCIYSIPDKRVLMITDVLTIEEMTVLGLKKKSKVELALDDYYLYVGLEGKKLTTYPLDQQHYEKFAPTLQQLIGPASTLPVKLERDAITLSDYMGIQPRQVTYTLDREPSFRGHNDSLLVYLKSMVTLPDNMKTRQEWKVLFTLEKDGRVSEVSVITDKKDTYGVGTQLKKAFETMPAWQPLTMRAIGAQKAFLAYDLEFKPYEMEIKAVGEVEVYDVVEQMPQFKGGDAALMDYLNKNIKYPVIAEENGIQGRVVTTFVVERDGSITDVQVIRSVDPSLDKEAVRVVSSMPKWKPGKQKGEPVRVKYTMPVTFRLQ